jgi:Sulfotransferase family
MAPSEEQLIVVIGRGHAGTRLLSQTLYASGVYMGNLLSSRGDTVPADEMYAAARIVAKHVEWNGGLSWDFEELHGMPIDPKFEQHVRKYLRHVLAAEAPQRGWKLPETTLAYPWIARMFPRARYLHIVRDPRDGLLKRHKNTDDLREFGVRCPKTRDALAQRVASWKYHYEIVAATPRPERFLTVRFEDLVLDTEPALRKLEEFLGIPLARIVIDRTRVGQWKHDPSLVPHVAPLAAEMRELGYES